MLTNYTSQALIHVVSLLAFQYTNDIWAMSISFAIIAYGLAIYVLGVGALLSPELSVEIDDDEYEYQSDYAGRGILQVVIMIVAYMLWQIDYPFIAGILGLQAVTILMSCIISIYTTDPVSEEDEE